MGLFWQNYKVAIVTCLVLFVGYGGYRGIIAFQSYETSQINTAVQLKTSQLEQQFLVQATSSTEDASTTVDNRVNQLETQIQQLQAAQTASAKATTPASTAQINALQKQVAAIKNASSGPVITFVNPTVMIAGYKNTVSINGTGFESGAKVELGDAGLQVSGIPTPTLISAAYPSGFNPGVYGVTVTNPDGGQFTFPSAITINPGTPTPANTAQTTAQIVSEVSPSVVLIRTDLGCGTGMVIQQNGGYILTDYHVIEGGTSITVYTPNGNSWNANVVGEDTADDLAILSINDNNLPAVTFGDSSDVGLPLGSNVVAIGYPLTCNTDQTLDIEPGAVTARRTVPDLIYQGEFIQTSARVNPGDSGGPLVNSQGQVIGIDNAISTVDGIDENLTGIAFAIPVSVAQSDSGIMGLSSLDSGTTAQSNPVSPTPATNNNTATLNVSVTVNNSQGGTASPSAFMMTIIGSNPNPSSFPGDASGTQVMIDPDVSYGVNISSLTDYTSSNNGQCHDSGGIPPGDSANCAITETFMPASNP